MAQTALSEGSSRARVAISAVFCVDGAAIGGWMSHLPEVQRQHSFTTGELGETLLFSSVGALLAMTMTARLVHRYGGRRVILLAAFLLLLIVPFLMVPRGHGAGQIALAVELFAMGATNATLDIAMNDYAVAVQDVLRRPILSSVHGWWCLGIFAGGAGTSLANRLAVDPRLHLWIASALLGTLVVAARSGLTIPVDHDNREAAKFLLPKGPLLLIGSLAVLALFAEGAIWDWSAIYLHRDLGLDNSWAALGFGIGAAAMAVGRLTGDGIIARLGPAVTLRLCGAVTCAGLLLATALPLPVTAFAGLALAGFGLANAVPILFAAATKVRGVSSTAGIAAVASIGYAAFLGGPPLIGNLAILVSLRASLAFVGVLNLLVAVFGGFIARDANVQTNDE